MDDITVTTEVVINEEYGGFGLSKEAWLLLLKKGYRPTQNELNGAEYAEKYKICPYTYDGERNNPLLVEVVKELGDKANSGTELVVKKVTLRLSIDSFDGAEKIASCVVVRLICGKSTGKQTRWKR
jgi:hypothetical protein